MSKDRDRSRAGEAKTGDDRPRPGHARDDRTADAPTVATIERAGQGIAIIPPFEAAMRPLATGIHVAAVHPSLGFLTVTRPWPLYHAEDTPRGRQVVMPAGLEPVAQGLLERAGVAVVVEERDVLPLPTPEPPGATAGAVDRAVLDFVRGHERGLIRIGPGVSPARLVADVRIAYPGATIAVAATRREDVRRFGRALKEIIPGACWSTGDDFPADPGPLVVTPFMGLADHGVAVHRRDFLFCLDAREALGRVACLAIGHAERARLYGFIGGDERLAPYDRDRVWAVFGFDSLDVPRHGHVARTVEVFRTRIVGNGPALRADVVTLKRGGIWAHPVRNRRMARLAAALAGGDRTRVAAEHPAIAARLTVEAPNVVVLVEGIGHAQELAPYLPGWRVLVGLNIDPASLPESLARVLSDRPRARKSQQIRAIATLDGLIQVDLTRVDVLVRVDGGTGVPKALTSDLITPHGDGVPLLLIDCDDRHHPELRRRARGRREAYLALGWPVDGQGGPMTPTERFLATRPGRSR